MPKRQPDNDERLAALLARGVTRSKAAKACGISERTIRRRMAEPEFRARVATIRAQLLDSVAGRLASAGRKAVSTLSKLLDADSEGVRLQAASTILSVMFKAREAVDVETRLIELEAAARAARNGEYTVRAQS